ERKPAIAGARHGAQSRCGGDLSARAQESQLRGLGLALEQDEGDVAAEQGAAFMRKSVVQARRDRADAGNRHHAKRDGGDEDVESAQAPAQLAERIAERQRARAAAMRRDGRTLQSERHELATRSRYAPSIRPERNRITRSQRCASCVSWVTSTSVMPRSA